jgi:uncharacterized protein involved in exopolysaccharide biosynthesis
MATDSTLASQGEPAYSAGEKGIDLFALLIALLEQWRLAVVTTVIAAVVFTAFIYSLKPKYVAKASIVPQETRGEGSSLAAFFSARGPGTLYLGLLQSRSVQDAVVKHEDLMTLFKTTSPEAARNTLDGKTTVSEDANTLITISVKDGNAQDAARIANAYLQALQDLVNAMAVQPSSQTAAFFETQLAKASDDLSQAESDLARTQKSTGLVAPESQTQLGLTAIAQLRAQRDAALVQLTTLLQSETDLNPQVVRLRAQIAQLDSQERTLEGNGSSPVGAAPAAGEMPQTRLDMDRALRSVKYHEQIVSSLASQYEAAKLNENFARPAFQVVDRAIVPENKAWPPRKPFFAAALIFAVLLGFIAVVARLTLRRIQSDPEHAAQLRSLRAAFARR